MTSSTTTMTKSGGGRVAPTEALIVDKVTTIMSGESTFFNLNGDRDRRFVEDGFDIGEGGFSRLGENGVTDMLEGRVKAHEEDVLELGVFDLATQSGETGFVGFEVGEISRDRERGVVTSIVESKPSVHPRCHR